VNPKKLIEAGFGALSAGETMASHIKRHKIAKDTEINVVGGYFREMAKKDIP
jgi:hypothetical protein